MAFQTSTRSSLEADDARSEPLGTRLRASAYRNKCHPQTRPNVKRTTADMMDTSPTSRPFGIVSRRPSE